MAVPAEVADWNLVRDLLRRLQLPNPQITSIWASSAYAGTLVTWTVIALLNHRLTRRVRARRATTAREAARPRGAGPESTSTTIRHRPPGRTASR